MKKTNIILIYADDLGRGMLSCYGQKYFKTPNIDRIAHEGVKFERAYGCAFCAPARASLITGWHDCHRGGWTFTPGGCYNRFTQGRLTRDELSELIHTYSHQPDDRETFLGQVAQEAGYVTAEIGKLEWGFATTDQEIRRHGWDYHYGYYDHQQCHGFYPPYLFENGEVVKIKGNTRDDFGKRRDGESPENKEHRWNFDGCATYSQDLFDQKIEAFLEKNQNNPFLLFHPTQLPHGPIVIEEIHPDVKNIPDLTDYEKEYASMILRLDQTVGVILDKVKQLGIDENTAIFFSSDNGHATYYREEGHMNPQVNLKTGESYDNVKTKFYTELSNDVFNGNDGMAGLKFTNWEGGVRIPFMVRWPGVVEPGTVSNHMIANYDFMTTVASIVGVPAPEDKDGISYLPELSGKSDQQTKHDYVVYASPLGPALTTEDGWKFRHLRVPKNTHYQLYHLPSDPREEQNVVMEADNRDVANRLSTALLAECTGNFANGQPETHTVRLPGHHYYGPECHWGLAP